MIGRVEGKLVAKDLDSLEVMTSGGVAYELKIPLGVYETLPRVGDIVALHTSLVQGLPSSAQAATLFGCVQAPDEHRSLVQTLPSSAQGAVLF